LSDPITWKPRVSITLEEGVIKSIDEQRGLINRSVYINALLKYMLNNVIRTQKDFVDKELNIGGR